MKHGIHTLFIFFSLIIFNFVSLFLVGTDLHATIQPVSSKVSRALFTNIDMITPSNKESFRYNHNSSPDIQSFCNKLDLTFKKYNWFSDPCANINWISEQKTKSGNPLIYTEFGTGDRSTMIFSGVHPDELVAIPIGFKLASYLQENPDIYKDKNIKIIIAPLLNPDGLFLDKPTRANTNGVDLNRNFFTKDWYTSAKKS